MTLPTSNYEFTADAVERNHVSASSSWTGYDATVTTSRRQSPKTVIKSEDDILSQSYRRKLVATANDLPRNFTVARWMIQKHLDFVVPHSFKGRTGDKGLDRDLEQFVEYASTADRFDAIGQHDRETWNRIKESCRVLSGDMATLRIRGGFVQGIESDRIRNPGKTSKRTISRLNGLDSSKWVHGIYPDRRGRAALYAIHKRGTGTNYEFERLVPANRIQMFGYYDFRFDQRRGVSPISTAINELLSVYRGLDYALAREQANKLVAMIIRRDSEISLMDDGDDEDEREPYSIDFDGGPIFLDMDPGEDLEMVRSPGTESDSVSFWETVIMIALKALDLPYSFYREDFTNFFGSRAALLLYTKSCRRKRKDHVRDSNAWLTWRLNEAARLGEFDFANRQELDRPHRHWIWIPEGTSWWNPPQEVKANSDAVDTFQRDYGEIRQEQFGDDWYDMIDRRKAQEDYLVEVGLKSEPAEMFTGE